MAHQTSRARHSWRWRGRGSAGDHARMLRNPGDNCRNSNQQAKALNSPSRCPARLRKRSPKRAHKTQNTAKRAIRNRS
eukprot:1399745-Lingulodinium_polyedra.AAC.1